MPRPPRRTFSRHGRPSVGFASGWASHGTCDGLTTMIGQTTILEMEGPIGRAGRPRQRRGRRGKLGELLRAARAARGLSQEAAARELGIARTMLAQYETGAQRPVGLALRYLLEVWIPRSLEERGSEGDGER